MKSFDIVTCPLFGTNLIEASAGTGKTYAIAGLYLRLLLERRLPVHRILVVTFTDAATNELRIRIRQRLREVLLTLTEARIGDGRDDFLNAIYYRFHRDEETVVWLQEALRDFDEAAICTIHSFCRQTLKESSFESGAAFDAELISDQSDLVQEVVDDFWRRHFYTASPLFVSYAAKEHYDRDHLMCIFGMQTLDPETKVVPAIGKPEITGIEIPLQALHEQLRLEWKENRTQIIDILSDQGLKRNVYTAKTVSTLPELMDAFLLPVQKAPTEKGDDSRTLFPFSTFEKFTASCISKNTKKDCEVPDHRFFHLCQEYFEMDGDVEDTYKLYLTYLSDEFLRYSRIELSTRKAT